MILIGPARRPARAGEWNEGAAIMFIVTLAATGTVTLAARAAGMSRKAAYALKKRDPLFAGAWQAATRTAAPAASAKGDKPHRDPPSISSTDARSRYTRFAGFGSMPAWRAQLLGELRSTAESGPTATVRGLVAREPS